MIERRAVPGFDGYEATSTGVIISIRTGMDRPLKARLHKGYMHVFVKTRPGRENNVKVAVHQLVLAAFHGGSPFVGAECRHLNGDALDNRPDNLAWGTRQDNLADQVRHGTDPSKRRGMCHPRVKLTDEQVAAIRARYVAGTTRQADIAAAFGISQRHVSDIIRGNSRADALAA